MTLTEARSSFEGADHLRTAGVALELGGHQVDTFTSADLVGSALAGEGVGTWFVPNPDAVTLSTGPVGAVTSTVD